MCIRQITAFIVLIALLMVFTPIAYCSIKRGEASDENKMMVIELWQIDGFEGGKGSRAEYLSEKAGECFNDENIYFRVISMSAAAARMNIAEGNLPDIISYNSGFYGIDEYINDRDFTSMEWCNGCYCLISLDESADFTDISQQNTIINGGKDNLSEVCAVLEGLGGAQIAEPSNAYLGLIDGKYKYLLGTQRDLFRFAARERECKIKPLSAFSDLRQNISIIVGDRQRYAVCKEFAEYLSSHNDVSSLGLFSANTYYSDNVQMNELSQCKSVSLLPSTCSENYIDELVSAAQKSDINKIKNLIK